MGLGAVLNHFSRVQLFATPWTAAHQAPLSREYPGWILEWVTISSPGDLPHPGIKAASLVSLALAGSFFITVPPNWVGRGLGESSNLQHI